MDFVVIFQTLFCFLIPLLMIALAIVWAIIMDNRMLEKRKMQESKLAEPLETGEEKDPEKESKFYNWLNFNAATLDEARVTPYKAMILIGIYVIVFFGIASVLGRVLLSLYMLIHNISKEQLLNDEALYNSCVTAINPIYQLTTYILAFVPVFILALPLIIKSFKRLEKADLPKVFIGYGLVLAGSIIGTVILGMLQVNGDATNEQAINDMLFSSPAAFLMMSFVTVLLAPILEELVFRLGIFSLFKNRTRLAIVVSSVLFGFLHVVSGMTSVIQLMGQGAANMHDLAIEFVYIISYALMGAGLSIVYVMSKRNVVVSIGAHMLNNTISLILTLLLYIVELIGKQFNLPI